MLPEVLSNDLCSLNPNEDKFTFSAVFKMDAEGKVLEEWFGRTVYSFRSKIYL
jgi:ribonuclease R